MAIQIYRLLLRYRRCYLIRITLLLLNRNQKKCISSVLPDYNYDKSHMGKPFFFVGTREINAILFEINKYKKNVVIKNQKLYESKVN